MTADQSIKSICANPSSLRHLCANVKPLNHSAFCTLHSALLCACHAMQHHQPYALCIEDILPQRTQKGCPEKKDGIRSFQNLGKNLMPNYSLLPRRTIRNITAIGLICNHSGIADVIQLRLQLISCFFMIFCHPDYPCLKILICKIISILP